LKTAAPGTSRLIENKQKPTKNFKLQKDNLLSKFASKKVASESRENARRTVM